ncbi:MAG: EexN family lipoprotein [Burkholderiales bacterium]|nr:EexN family lipoprotein [Burkholderiales bacterium]MBK8665514.1 EexN family lipoprotein [Burkholderiales bacterium]
MTRTLIVTAVLLLAACGKPDGPRTVESVEALVADPHRLSELRAACRADRARLGDAQCHAVAEATRQRFMRRAPSPYADDPIQPGSAP